MAKQKNKTLTIIRVVRIPTLWEGRLDLRMSLIILHTARLMFYLIVFLSHDYCWQWKFSCTLIWTDFHHCHSDSSCLNPFSIISLSRLLSHSLSPFLCVMSVPLSFSVLLVWSSIMNYTEGLLWDSETAHTSKCKHVCAALQSTHTHRIKYTLTATLGLS